jgi:hypothetical protein
MFEHAQRVSFQVLMTEFHFDYMKLVVTGAFGSFGGTKEQFSN